ncbi:MAG: HEAT repeat domain-containing protein [Planctomycetes bacterium]|nr:HEAT repeat domain-containing protein [Planctomycetota bacterium]
MTSPDTGGVAKTMQVLAATRTDLAFEAVLAGLREPDDTAMLHAVRALLEWGREEGLLEVIRAYAAMPAAVQQEVSRREGRLRKVLRQALQARDPNTRQNVLDIVAGADQTEDLPYLIPAMLDAHPTVARKAAQVFESRVASFAARRRRVLEAIPGGAKANAGVLTEASLDIQREEKGVLAAAQAAVEAGHVHRQAAVLLAALDLEEGGYRVVWGAMKSAHACTRFLSATLSEADDRRVGAFLFYAMFESHERFPEALRALVAGNRGPATAAGFAEALARRPLAAVVEACKRWQEIPWWPMVERLALTAPADFLALNLGVARGALDGAAQASHLRALLATSHLEVVNAVLASLDELNTPAAAEAIAGAFDSQSEAVQTLATSRVAASKIANRHELLARQLNSPFREVRRAAAQGLTAGKKEKYLAAFEQLDERTREAAGKAIARIDESFVEQLTDDLSAVDETRRLKALKVIAAIGKEKDIERQVLELMRDPSKLVRSYAVNMLAAFGGVEAMKALIAALNDPDRRVKSNAIEAFEALGNPKVIDLLLPFLRHDDNRVRTTAAKALWTLGRRDVGPMLVAMLDDPDEKLRLSTVWALSEIEMDGREALLRRARDQDQSEKVRAKAAEVLAAK